MYETCYLYVTTSRGFPRAVILILVSAKPTCF